MTSFRDELPAELKALFVTGYITGLRRGEITAIQWPQVDFEAGLITLEKGETKNDDPRSVPILDGDMRDLLLAAKKERDAEVAAVAVGLQPRAASASLISGGLG